eukprot:SAG31_NODE_1150_length_9648_cov_37.362656_6_plen_408_part_00
MFGKLLMPTEPMDTKWHQFVAHGAVVTYNNFLAASQRSTDRFMQDDLTIVFAAFCPFFSSVVAGHPDWKSDSFGRSRIKQSMRIYSYDRMHKLFMDRGFGDPFAHSAIGARLALVSGDLDVWEESVDFTTNTFMLCVEDKAINPREVQNILYFGGVFGAATWNTLLKRADASRRCYRSAGLSWVTVDTIYDAAPVSVTGTWRPRGMSNEDDYKGNAYMITAEGVISATKCSWIMSCAEDELPTVDDFLDSLLPPAQFAKDLMPNKFINVMVNGVGHANPFVLAACACERYGAHCWEMALSYCDQAMVTDMQSGGGDCACDRAFACLVRGRIRAGQNHIADALQAFEDAAREAERIGYTLLRTIAFHERKKLLDGQGAGENDREAAERIASFEGLNVSLPRLTKFLEA